MNCEAKNYKEMVQLFVWRLMTYLIPKRFWNNPLPDQRVYTSQHRSLGIVYEDEIKNGTEEPISSVIRQLASEIRNRCPELIKR